MESNLDNRFHVLLRQVSAIMFCGCPHRGSDAASLGLLASRMVAFALTDANSKFLSDLEVDSETLDLINKDFLTTLERELLHVRIHSFQEAQPITGIRGLNSKASVATCPVLY